MPNYISKITLPGSAGTYDIKDAEARAALANTDTVLGADTTFTGTATGTAVGSTTKYLSAAASGAAVSADGTATAVTGYANPSTSSIPSSIMATSKKLVTTTVPNVTGAGSASSWSFAMGTGTGNTETLIISGANGSAPSLGTAITVATGSTDNNGGGATVVTAVQGDETVSVLTGLGTPTTATVLTGVKMSSQPSVTLTANNSTGQGRIEFVQALGTVTQPTISVTAGSDDTVTAYCVPAT